MFYYLYYKDPILGNVVHTATAENIRAKIEKLGDIKYTIKRLNRFNILVNTNEVI